MKKFKILIELFVAFFKIGLFTFGGGYAMIGLIERVTVENKKWLTKEEMKDILAISESTPGPLSINIATFVGYRTAGAIGSIIATLALAIPSLIIIFIISLFINEFLANETIAKAFEGIKVAVVILVINAGFKLKKNVQKQPIFTVILVLTIIIMLTSELLTLGISSIYLIIISAALGVILQLFSPRKEKNR